MRGNGARALLPALVVLALVGVVAIAATGSTSTGSGRVRPPSATLLDTILTLGFLAVLAGAVLLVYGLTQRRAIANELASGRFRRTSLVSYLAFFAAFTTLSYWRLRSWQIKPAEEKSESAFPGATPVPGTPGTTQETTYEPSIAWLPIAVVLGLAAAAGIAYLVARRRAQRAARVKDTLEGRLVAVFDETLGDLRSESDPRRAVIAAFARLEHVLATHGYPRRSAETQDEYVGRILGDLDIEAGAIRRLTALFERAKFSQHDVDLAMKEEAIGALEQVRDELRQAPAAPEQALEAELTTPGAAS